VAPAPAAHEGSARERHVIRTGVDLLMAPP
jgi:hypothetical protein